MTDRADLRRIVLDALRAHAGLDQTPEAARKIAIGEDVAFSELDMDSLTGMEVAMQIESDLDRDLDLDEIEQAGSVDGLVDYLARQQGDD